MDDMPGNRARLLERLDQLIASGRVTEEEARRLRSADTAEDHEVVIAAIRSRHAGARLDAAVAEGAMSRAEADENLERIARGEHPKGLRAHLRSIRRH